MANAKHLRDGKECKSQENHILTTFLAGDMTFAGVLYLMHAPFLMKAFVHLGLPCLFPQILWCGEDIGSLCPAGITVELSRFVANSEVITDW